MRQANMNASICVLALAAFFLGTALIASVTPADAASPSWKVAGVTGPTNLPPESSEIQAVTVDATGGTFTLSFQAENTIPIDFDATPGEFAAALNDLPSIGGIGGSVEVEGGPGDEGGTTPYYVRFGDALDAADVVTMSAGSGSLTGSGATATVDIQTEGGTPGQGEIAIQVANVGGADGSGTMTLDLELPAGIETTQTPFGGDFFQGEWACSPAGAGQSDVTCTFSGGLFPPHIAVEQMAPRLIAPVTVNTSSSAGATARISVEGGGAPPAASDEFFVPVNVSSEPVSPGIQALWAGAFDDDGMPLTQAGDHPARAAAFLRINTILSPSGAIVPAGDVKDVEVEVPPGFVGNPLAMPRCPQEERTCGSESEAGRSQPSLSDFRGLSSNEPLYNNEPSFGYPAQFTFPYAIAEATLVGSLRSNKDYGVTIVAPNIPLIEKFFSAFTVLNGDPPGAEGTPFLTNPTGCSDKAQGDPITRIGIATWQAPSLFDSETVDIPKVTGCDELEFKARKGEEGQVGFTFQPSTDDVASTTAATAHLHIDQSGLLDAEELATPHLKRSVVELPDGLVLNPAGANGLDSCSSDEIGLITTNGDDPNPVRFDKSSPDCPDASKIGTVEVSTPLLEDPLDGVVYLAAQGDNPFGSLVAIYLAIDDRKTGITVKLPGEVKRDPETGQITTVFDHNPQLPVEDLTLKVRGGDRSSLATPDVCGDYETEGTWTPWSAPESGPAAETFDDFDVDDGSPCPDSKAERPFAPGFAAGSSIPSAGQHSPFTLRLTRPDGHQEIDRLTATIPPGLTANLKGVPACPEAVLAATAGRDGEDELASPACPAASQIGSTTVGAGVGPEPIFVDGRVYLAGPYKGAPLSLAFIVPAVAGPFDLGVQVIRTALHVNPRTAQITAVSDPLPKILEGVPLQVRDVRVRMDRPGFTLNPTSCEQMAISAQVIGASGAVADVANRFQVGDCAALKFEPRLNLRLFGGVKRGAYQGLRAVVRPRPGDANISRTAVRMPRSAFLAQEHIRTVCTRVQFAADACPAGAIYGKAIAWSPLLDYPLRGNVYLRSSDNELPDVVADLRGPAHQPIKVEVVGRTDSVKGALRNTFDVVPDAPVSYFRLNLFGGKKGLIVNSRNICRGQNRAAVGLNAHNGRRALLRPVLRNKRCAALRKGNKRKAAKRRANRSKRRGA